MVLLNEKYPLKEYYSKIYRKYDLVNRIFTLGQDKRWRKKTAEVCLANNSRNILDLCCGTGDLAIEIAKQAKYEIFITGYDFSNDMLQLALQKTSTHEFNNINFIQGDVAKMPFPDATFDVIGITFGFRNLTYQNSNQAQHLKEIARVLKKDGCLIIMESAKPKNVIITFFYRLYLHLFLIPVGGLISGNYKAYKYLAKSSGNFFSDKEIEDMLSAFGFKDFRITKFLFGSTNLISARK